MAIERSRTRTRMLRRIVAVTLVCLFGSVALAACTPTTPPVSTPTPTTIFASEEEALAAATDVYQQYTAALDKVFAAGGEGDDTLAAYVTPEYLAELSEDGTLERNGWRAVGATTFDTASLVDITDSRGSVTLDLKLCRDVTAVRFVDGAGADVTPTSRLERFPVQVTFVSDDGDSDSLRITESDSWPGDDFC